MSDKIIARDWFYSQPKLPVPECAECENLKVYRLGYTGQYIIEMEIDSGLGGETVEIDQITDVHFNYISIADQDDRELMGTREKRVWLNEGASVKSAVKAMDVAAFADQTVVTGDTLDYLSDGAMMLTKRHIIDRDPSVMIALGGHELTKQMQTGLTDELSIEERLSILEKFWHHDMYYYSKDVGGKVIAVCLDNGQGRFWDSQVGKLDADIKRARAEGRILLIFMHEPIATRDYCGAIPTLWYSMGAHLKLDLCGANIIGAKPDEDAATKAVYSLITENADVVKGIFCGHWHSMFYANVKASYKDGENVKDAVIPQLIAPGNAYLDHAGRVVRIIVK